MKRNSQLSATLHALIHLSEHDGPMTSEQLAGCFDTNPVVVRRTLAGLRETGLVASGGGRGGGWTLTRALEKISLRDVYRALGEPDLFHIGPREAASTCLIDHAVVDAMSGAFNEAETLLLRRLGDITLADIAADFHKRHKKAKRHVS
jgi:DNA-binding IscR family transcriptional regulator